MRFRLFVKLVDVLRKCLLRRKVSLDSTFCVRTLRQVSLLFLGNEMNLSLSFLKQSDTLVIGRHLLLSPVSTAVKPAYSVFLNPNSIQEGGVAVISAESQVDVILGPWKNIGLTNVVLPSSVRFVGS